MSWVWMPLFYYTIAMPFALTVRFVKDPLKVSMTGKKSHWTPKELPELNLKWAQSQGGALGSKRPALTLKQPTLVMEVAR